MMIRARVSLLAVLLLMLSAGPSAAQTPSDASERTPRDGWIPSVIVGLNVFDFAGNGRATSPYGQDAFNAGRRTIEGIRFGVELVSPEFSLPFVRSRLMGYGGVQLGSEYTVTMAQRGEPNNILLAQQIEAAVNQGAPYPPIGSFEGQGSKVDALYEGLGWFLGMGTRLDVPGTDQRLRAKTAVTYFAEQVEARGQFVAAAGTLPNYTIFTSARQSGRSFHYIGPTLGLDLVFARTERFELSGLIDVDLLWNVGDDSIVLQDPGVSTLVYTAKDFRYNLQFGLRFAWRNAFGAR